MISNHPKWTIFLAVVTLLAEIILCRLKAWGTVTWLPARFYLTEYIPPSSSVQPRRGCFRCLLKVVLGQDFATGMASCGSCIPAIRVVSAHSRFNNTTS